MTTIKTCLTSFVVTGLERTLPQIYVPLFLTNHNERSFFFLKGGSSEKGKNENDPFLYFIRA